MVDTLWASEHAFGAARWKGIWRRLRRYVTHECNDLLPSTRVLRRLSTGQSRDLDVRLVPLDRIIGSSGRSAAFDLQFHPKQTHLRSRWLHVAQAVLSGKPLPPVRLLRVGRAHFVEDGHHRISVARAMGWRTIEAHVIELDPDGLEENPACTRLGYQL